MHRKTILTMSFFLVTHITTPLFGASAQELNEEISIETLAAEVCHLSKSSKNSELLKLFKKRLEIFLKKGNSIDTVDFFNTTLLEWAVDDYNGQLAAYLLQLGADCDKNNWGLQSFPLLHRACSYEGSIELVKLLLKEGASLELEDNRYLKARELAGCFGRQDVVQLIDEERAIRAAIDPFESHTTLVAVVHGAGLFYEKGVAMIIADYAKSMRNMRLEKLIKKNREKIEKE